MGNSYVFCTWPVIISHVSLILHMCVRNIHLKLTNKWQIDTHRSPTARIPHTRPSPGTAPCRSLSTLYLCNYGRCIQSLLKIAKNTHFYLDSTPHCHTTQLPFSKKNVNTLENNNACTCANVQNNDNMCTHYKPMNNVPVHFIYITIKN